MLKFSMKKNNITGSLKHSSVNYKRSLSKKNDNESINEEEIIKGISDELIEEFIESEQGIRLLGVGLSNLYDDHSDPQLKLKF